MINFKQIRVSPGIGSQVKAMPKGAGLGQQVSAIARSQVMRQRSLEGFKNAIMKGPSRIKKVMPMMKKKKMMSDDGSTYL